LVTSKALRRFEAFLRLFLRPYFKVISMRCRGGNGSGAASSDIGGSGIVIISYIIGNTATTYDSMVDVPGITTVTSQS
jgi:hypothetical protein